MIAALIGFAIMFALAFIGFPLVVSMLLVGAAGFAVFRGYEAAVAVVGQQMVDAAASYGFSVIPLFVLMGAFIHRGGLADDLFGSARAWLGHVPGGIAHATIGASAAFSAVCGSSVAAAATMSRVALPQLRRYNYEPGFACGTVAAGGTLGILIPPSIPLVVFGILTETDIAALFMAGVLPGLLLASLYMLAAWILIVRSPTLGQPAPKMPIRERLIAFQRTMPVAVLFLVVVLGMYSGIFTPTEAAGVGAFFAFILMALRGKATFAQVSAALVETMLTTGAILAVVGSALVFNNFLTISGLTAQLIGWVESLAVSPIGVILAICLIYLVLGCIFDSLAAMILTAPVFTPIVVSLGYDPVWFGILVAVAVEMGLITPPLGMNVFIVQNQAREVSVWRIFRGVTPYIGANLVLLLALIAVPAIALILPNL